jgi:hypothetical protein
MPESRRSRRPTRCVRKRSSVLLMAALPYLRARRPATPPLHLATTECTHADSAASEPHLHHICVFVLSPVQKAAQEKDALIAQLQGEIEAQKAGSERELSCVSSALSRATEEAREKCSLAEDALSSLGKLNMRVSEYQACLERVGVNAVSLQVHTHTHTHTHTRVSVCVAGEGGR